MLDTCSFLGEVWSGKSRGKHTILERESPHPIAECERTSTIFGVCSWFTTCRLDHFFLYYYVTVGKELLTVVITAVRRL